jgi:hypothetical protein
VIAGLPGLKNVLVLYAARKASAGQKDVQRSGPASMSHKNASNPEKLV